MKKMKRFAYAGAIALLCMFGFSACSSSDDAVTIDNPNYNPIDNSVKAQLAISLGSGSTMRMANDIVQGQSSPVFRGMQDMRLIAMNNWVAKSEVDADATGSIKAYNDKVINLGAIDVLDLETQKAKVYSDLSIPVGTKAFLFYARAKKGSATYPTGATASDKAHLDKFHNGSVVAPTDYTVAIKDFQFALEPIQPNIYESTTEGVTTQHNVNERATTLLNYVKGIRAVSLTNKAMHAYVNAFQPTAGSSASIEFAVQDLWDKIRAIPVTTAAEQQQVNAIKAAITSQDALGGACATIDENNKVTFTMEKMKNYPANIFLPDGAAGIDWEDSNNPKVIVGGHNGTVNIAPLNTYVYPAELIYRANTSIGVSDNEKVSNTYGTNTWAEITTGESFYTWDGEVKGSTQSIALKNHIEYAVGRLDLQVKAAAGVLKDYKGNSVTVPTGGFPISAVLIGHQRPVNYQFGPKEAVNAATAYTIYDNEMTEPMAALNNAAQGTNKTLVFESGSDLTKVNVCVEFTNTSGSAFVSKHGIVPAGGKFYLVGTLDLDSSSGSMPEPKMIFKQDYVTQATFTISELGDQETGLGVAYNVIPDLKTPQLELAFSVDLEWRQGLVFDVNF